MKLIIGLGNPDKEYEATRHNFGWLALDSLAAKKEISWTKHKQSNSLIASWQGKKEKIIFAKPLTYMNNSGKAVKALKQYYKTPVNRIIVIYDDIDLPYGKIRISKNRSAGGHKGIDSMIAHLKSKDFKRIRLGIGPQKGKAEDYVLKKFSSTEKKKLNEILDTSHLILEDILSKSFDQAANKYN
ncbi:MAG: aminoacyl-tRNA hydrolase [Candidatus Komeilibacteria bacterium]|jgi:peptidyl-tRNA hydrolase, PTH1 family|nr:aminoacyl-tRNA hydrolase [Candidatus Komeilibacteria bacterium]MBT4447244.1 aminoacyl-tRNA hydrolase [Candidatus Komeilibacteria bacterium]